MQELPLKEALFLLNCRMSIAILIVFVLGYIAIAFESVIRLNKAAIALISGVLCWTILFVNSPQTEIANTALEEHLATIAGILFFLLGAMTIVELIDAHDGFEVITGRIQTTDKRKLLWIVCILTFFLSALLDNLTTAIVMVTLIRKLLKDKETRLWFCGMVVIAANAGGAWSPIGDVTTTMLWIGGQISSWQVIIHVFLPAVTAILVPLLIAGRKMKGQLEFQTEGEGVASKPETPIRERNIVFYSGLSILLLVPVFKTLTHLPPYMGMLLGLGLIWVITEIIHSGKDEQDKNFHSVLYAIRKADTPSILFFLGILLSVAALEASGVLGSMATQLDKTFNSSTLIVSLIGLLSAIVDNVPLVAASMGMYSMDQYATDHFFWHFLAYCTGVGGSILIIGSAAGIAAMGIEKIEFFWYLKKIGWLALVGYISGILVFLLLQFAGF